MNTTPDGCPQFELADNNSELEPNEQLREWHESRRCNKCENFELDKSGFSDDMCFYLKAQVLPNFSCQAFEEKK